MNNKKIENHIKNKYDIIELKGKGAYGYVWKVKDKENKKIYALKKIFEAFQNSTDAQRTYREIFYLKLFNNFINIIKLHKVIKSENKRDLYWVFDYMESDLHIVIRSKILQDIHKKFIIYQIFKAIKFMHSVNIIHRDLKPSNILIDSNCWIKIADFGLARQINSSYNEENTITENVATRWYRAPEILLKSTNYDIKADIWSIGCIIAEILLSKVLFKGETTKNQIEIILEFCGKPKNNEIAVLKSSFASNLITEMTIRKNNKYDKLLEKIDPLGLDLIKSLLKLNPNERLSIDDSMKHPFLKEFYNPNEIIKCNNNAKIKIKDTKKLKIKDYIKQIYEDIDNQNNKPKILTHIISKKNNTSKDILKTKVKNKLKSSMNIKNDSIKKIYSVNKKKPTKTLNNIKNSFTNSNKSIKSNKNSFIAKKGTNFSLKKYSTNIVNITKNYKNPSTNNKNFFIIKKKKIVKLK